MLVASLQWLLLEHTDHCHWNPITGFITMCTSCPPVQVLCTNTPPSYLLLLFQPELFITIHHPLCTITCYKTCAHHIHQVMCTNTPSSYLQPLPLQPEPFITGAHWPPPPPPARTILQNGIKAACSAALLSQLKTSHWADNHMICTREQLFSNPNLFISFHWWPWSLSQNLARHADDCAQVKVRGVTVATGNFPR